MIFKPNRKFAAVDNFDPIMEETNAAMNGINYWTGEKISKIQAFGIIAGGMLYQYEAIRGNFRGNRNIKTVPNGFSDPKYKKKGETSTSSNNPNKPPETKGTGNGVGKGTFGSNTVGAAEKYVPKNIKMVDEKVLKKNGIDAHQLKDDVAGGKISRYDIYVDKDTGQLWVYLKGGKGEGIPTGEYIK